MGELLKLLQEWMKDKENEHLEFKEARPPAFHRKIVMNEFGGNPKDSGEIEMQLSKKYRNNFFGMALRIQGSELLF
jgi:hypothetical protein